MAKLRLCLLMTLGVLNLGMPLRLSGAITEKVALSSVDLLGNAPTADTPQKLRDVWISFHEDNLCQKVDAAFVFHRSELDVLVNIQSDKKSLKKLAKILEPLQDSYQIDLKSVLLKEYRDPAKIKNPPSSFLMNSELRLQFKDSFSLNPILRHQRFLPYTTTQESATMLWRRLLVFAKDTLDYNRKMKSYAAHLPSLVEAAFDPAATEESRNRSLKVCRKHAQKLEEYTKKLNKNLSWTLPKTKNKSDKTTTKDTEIMAGTSLAHSAVRLSTEAQNLYFSVYRLLYPQQHSVSLTELFNPSILQSLENLRRVAVDFHRTIG